MQQTTFHYKDRPGNDIEEILEMHYGNHKTGSFVRTKKL
jgi:hypothetical protein